MKLIIAIIKIVIDKKRLQWSLFLVFCFLFFSFTLLQAFAQYAADAASFRYFVIGFVTDENNSRDNQRQQVVDNAVCD